MAEQSHTINTAGENSGPTLEESAAALQAEGLMPGGDTSSSGADAEGGESTEARPSWLPEKFKTPEDMAKAYGELEKKQSTPNETPDASQSEPTSSEGDPDGAEGDEGFQLDAFYDEYDENGSLSDKSYAALEAAGFDRATVDGYIQGQEAINTLYEHNVKNIVGGGEAYDALIEWAKVNLDDAGINAYDSAVNSGDLTVAKSAVEGLQARMKLAQGNPPARQLDGNTSAATDSYSSQAQIEADMNDPRYETDPAFRQSVYDKMARSEF